MTVGDRIKELRGQINLGQGELAKIASISQGYLSQVEKGDVQSISLQVAYKLSEALGVTIYVLLDKEQTTVKVLPKLAAKLTEMSMEKQKKLLKFLVAGED